MNLVEIWLVGAYGGLHAATWRAFKDSPFVRARPGCRRDRVDGGGSSRPRVVTEKGRPSNHGTSTSAVTFEGRGDRVDPLPVRPGNPPLSRPKEHLTGR